MPLNLLPRTSSDAIPYLAQLYGLAGRISPSLREISLDHILSGTTCSPIGLVDFEMYLSYVENSLENLQFVVWFQCYRERFFALPPEIQSLSPGSSKDDFDFSRPAPARTEAQRIASLVGLQSLGLGVIHPNLASTPTSAASETSTLVSTLGWPLSPISTRLSSGVARPTATTSQQPFRDECARVVATFLRPGARKELSLDADVRDSLLRALTYNTHPGVFLPVYEEIYHSLATVSLPHFLLSASAVMNRPKQLMFTIIAVLLLFLTVFSFFITIFLIPVPPQHNRGYRFFVVAFATLAALDWTAISYSMCLTIGNRGRRQVRPWEMEESDKSTEKWWRQMVLPPPVLGHPESEVDDPKVAEEGRARGPLCEHDGDCAENLAAACHYGPANATRRRAAMVADIALIAPFADPEPAPKESSEDLPVKAKPVFATSQQTHTVTFPQAVSQPHGNARNGFRRPPLWGPEMVVMDPRIRAFHASILKKVYRNGVITFLVTAAIVFPLPSYI